MNLFEKIGVWLRREKREQPAETGTSSDLLEALLPSNGVTEKQAMNIPTFAACVNLISNIVSTIPFQLYRKTDGKAERIEDDIRVRLINNETGDIMDGSQLKRAVVVDYLLNGAGYVYINKQRNTFKSLHYVDPSAISVLKNSDPIYKTADFMVNGQRYRDFDFIKLCRYTKDGATGKGIVSENNEALTAMYNLLKFEKVLAITGGNKKGFLKAQRELDKKAMADLRAAWQKMYSDTTENVMVLNAGIDFQDISSTSTEMQLNEHKRSNAAEICRIFGIPTIIFDGQATDDVWQMMFKTAINHILTAFEAALNKDFLLESEKPTHYFAADTSVILRGDILKRYQAYEIAVRNNILLTDDCRAREGEPPLGMDFIRLKLSDVFYDIKTKTFYTPNTNQQTKITGGEKQSEPENES